MENEKRIMTEQDAIVAAEQELSVCRYIAECTRNSGMRAIHRKRCEWLSVLVGLAKKAIKADAVEVVRCRDCKYWTYDNYHKHNYCSNKFGLRYVCPENNFCSNGERKDENK